MTEQTASLNKALLVFARHLVDEMRYINYPKEWSRPPLKNLLPQFFEVLNYHPDKLGDLLKNAYDRTFPELQKGNINQLSTKMIESTKDYCLFGKTRQYYLDEFEIMGAHDNVSVIENAAFKSRLMELFKAIIDTFARLEPTQENEHRTLEHVCFALAPIYERVSGAEEAGWNLAEYADQWRRMSGDERNRLAAQLAV